MRSCVCGYCGVTFSNKNRHYREWRFCSLSCSISSRNKNAAKFPVDKTCEWCGSSYEVRSRATLANRRFCSRSCSTAYRKSLPKSEITTVHQKMAAFACSAVARCLRMKGEDKSDRITTLLGYRPLELRRHIESLWSEGMSWENYGKGGWHIDHIVPISHFPSDAPVSVINNLSNLQPLWEKDNLRKGNRMVGSPVSFAVSSNSISEDR